MSLKLNVAANYASQLYATLIGIVLVPLFLRHMGAEAYGLIGFYAVLQVGFNVLDLGLTPTIARESARYFGGALTSQDYRRLYRALGLIFIAVALVGGGALLLLAPVVAERWLNVSELPLGEVEVAVQIMAICVAMRWMAGLYRGVITGAERLVWISGFNTVIATLRFAAVFASMEVWGYTPKVFFVHQLVVAALELGILYLMAARLMPRPAPQDPPTGFSFAPVAPLLRFSLTIAITSSIWVFATQTDKLILSGILPLAEYGFFTLAVLVASGITIVTAPITTALLPRIARLHAEGNHAEVLRLYHTFAQLVGVVAISLLVTLACCAEPLLFAWTGDREASIAAAPVLRLYAIGNGLLALGAFPFYLQYARGNLRYHLIGNIGLVVLLIPSIAFAALRAGGIGAGWVWLATNAIYLFGWVAFVHGRLEPGLHAEWMQRNVLPILVPTALVGIVISAIPLAETGGRWPALMQVIMVMTACIAIACLGAADVRRRVLGSRFQGIRQA